MAGSCTSTVANTADGKGIVHGRNLDYIGYATPGYGGLFTDVIQVNFVKDDQIMYTCDTYASYVGCLTGMKPGKFSISLNQSPSVMLPIQISNSGIPKLSFNIDSEI